MAFLGQGLFGGAADASCLDAATHGESGSSRWGSRRGAHGWLGELVSEVIQHTMIM